MQKILADIWRHRFALRNLVMKDFRVRYRNMSLGVLWSILNPLVMLGILMFVFTFVFPQDGSQPFFPVFLLLGLVCFNFLSLCINTSTISLAVAFGVSVITLIIGLYIFNRTEKVFADLI